MKPTDELIKHLYHRHQGEEAKELSRLPGIQKKVDEGQLQTLDTKVEAVKATIRNGFSDAAKWKVKREFLKDTEQRIRVRLENLESTVINIDIYGKLFFHANEIPHNAMDVIQKEFKKQYAEWSSEMQFMIKETYCSRIQTNEEMESFKSYHMVNRMFQNKRPKLFPQESHSHESTVLNLLV